MNIKLTFYFLKSFIDQVCIDYRKLHRKSHFAQRHLVLKIIIYSSIQLMFSALPNIRHLWRLKIAIANHEHLICVVPQIYYKNSFGTSQWNSTLKKCKELFEHQHLFFLRYIWCSKFKYIIQCSFFQHQCQLDICGSLRHLLSCLGVSYEVGF